MTEQRGCAVQSYRQQTFIGHLLYSQALSKQVTTDPQASQSQRGLGHTPLFWKAESACRVGFWTKLLKVAGLDRDGLAHLTAHDRALQSP